MSMYLPANNMEDRDKLYDLRSLLSPFIYSRRAQAKSRPTLTISLGNRLPLLSVRVHVEPGTSLRAIATLTESKGRGLDNRRDIRKSYYVLASFYARPNAFPAIFREK